MKEKIDRVEGVQREFRASGVLTGKELNKKAANLNYYKDPNEVDKEIHDLDVINCEAITDEVREAVEDVQDRTTGKDTTRRKIQEVLYKLPVYILVSEEYERYVQDIIDADNKEQFERQVGITLDQFETVVTALNVQKLNPRIQENNIYQNSIYFKYT